MKLKAHNVASPETAKKTDARRTVKGDQCRTNKYVFKMMSLSRIPKDDGKEVGMTKMIRLGIIVIRNEGGGELVRDSTSHQNIREYQAKWMQHHGSSK